MKAAQKIFWVIIFNLLIILAEIVFGLVANSFALIADALHKGRDLPTKQTAADIQSASFICWEPGFFLPQLLVLEYLLPVADLLHRFYTNN